MIQKLKLTQKQLHLQQLILKAELMDMPPLALDSLILDLAKNPEEYEQKLISEKESENKAYDETNPRVRSFFNFSKTFTSEKKAKGGIITNIPLEIIPENSLGEPNIKDITIDGTYG